MRSPSLRRSTSFRAVGRFIGFIENAVYHVQWMCWVDGGFCVIIREINSTGRWECRLVLFEGFRCIGCCRLDPAHRVVEEGDEIAGDAGDNGMNETGHHE